MKQIKRGAKITNPRIGLEFNQLLQTNSVFKDNPKAIAAAYNLLKRMNWKSSIKKLNPIPYPYQSIDDTFKNYTNGKYAPYLYALRDLGILEFEIEGYDYDPNNKSVKGECRNYLLTELCFKLLLSNETEYLKKLHKDKNTMRNNQQSISKRKVLSKKYNDPIRDYIHDGLININYDYEQSQTMLNKSCWSNAQKVNVNTYLADFKTKTFKELVYSEETGRIFHAELNIKSGARVILKYKKQKYVGVLDLRSCYPTFLSSIILLHTNKINSLTEIERSELNKEHSKWVEIFTNPTIEPKEVIKLACGYEDISTAKSAMNEAINGSSQYPEFILWIKTNFPTLFNQWQTMNVKDTGNAIGREYESKLILNNEVFKLAKKMDIKLMPEADGYGVFSDYEWNDKELQSNLDKIKSFIQNSGLKQFGVPVVIKPKAVFDWTNADLLGEMHFKREELEKEYLEWKAVTSKAQKKSFSKQNKDDKELKKKFYKLKSKEYPILNRYRDVIDYWATN